MDRQLPPATAGHVRDAWAAYSLHPLQVVESPDSPWLPALADGVEDNLDHEIETQQPDGSWAPTSSWGDAYPEAWPDVRGSNERLGIVYVRLAQGK